MNSKGYHFTIGTFECTVITDGTLTYTDPAPLHFANAPSDRLAQALLKYDIQLDRWDEWISPLPCLIVQTGRHLVLVDTGLGSVDFAPHAGKLLQNLHAEGIRPDDVDAVILTHAHGDHIGGNAAPDGSAAFPHAR